MKAARAVTGSIVYISVTVSYLTKAVKRTNNSMGSKYFRK